MPSARTQATNIVEPIEERCIASPLQGAQSIVLVGIKDKEGAIGKQLRDGFDVDHILRSNVTLNQNHEFITKLSPDFEFGVSVKSTTHARPWRVNTIAVMGRSYTRLHHGFKQLGISPLL
jgi:hypothetical protein